MSLMTILDTTESGAERGADWTLDGARSTSSAASAQGAPWFFAFGITLTLSLVLTFFLPLNISMLIVMFQGGLAVPLAFALEARLGTGKLAKDHPLRSLSVQLAMVQIVALPAVIITYATNPALVPAVFAAIGGAHFLPYAWLHRSKVYLFVALVVSLGSWAIMMIGGAAAYQAVLVLWPLTYAVAGVLLLRKHRQLHPRA